MASAELQDKRPLEEAKLSALPSSPESAEATASSSSQTERVEKPLPAIPKTAIEAKSKKDLETRRSVTFLSRSFRALSSVLGLSRVTKSFKSKYDMPAEQLSRLPDANGGSDDEKWDDIVDTVVESENEGDSADSYIEFISHPGTVMHGGRLLRFGRKKQAVQREDNVAQNDDRIPWFEQKS